jgi:hypothetical protein
VTSRTIRLAAGLLALVLLDAPAGAQLRVATWNVSNYSDTLPSPRDPAFIAALYGVFEGRSLAPDVLIGQEFVSAASVTAFRSLLNAAPGSPGDWAAAPYVPGPDTNNAFFYRTGKVEFLGVTTISTGGMSPSPPRNTERYDIRPRGYGAGATLACYSSHMKSGSGADDRARRLTEAQRIRANAETLPPAWSFLLAADLNIPASGEAAYQALVSPSPSPAGQLFDPIMTPGSWNNNFAFRFVHTQAPGGNAATTGGMDDRFDQILLSARLIDGAGFEYIGNPALAYSTTTWNDPNHSYRAWGNDGSSFNQSLTINGNQIVGPTIAQALVDSTNGDSAGGHLPVFLDLRVPAKVDAPVEIDFGTVPPGSVAQAVLTITNVGDVPLWTAAGIADLRYSLAATAGFSVPPGPFAEPPGGGGNEHAVTLSTGTPGPVSGTITITSDDPDSPVRAVNLRAVVAAACYADCNADGVLNLADFGCFQTRFATANPYADCNGDGLLNLADFGCFQTRFALGCP